MQLLSERSHTQQWMRRNLHCRRTPDSFIVDRPPSSFFCSLVSIPNSQDLRRETWLEGPFSPFLPTPYFRLRNEAPHSKAAEVVSNKTEPDTIADGAPNLRLGCCAWPILYRSLFDILEVFRRQDRLGHAATLCSLT